MKSKGAIKFFAIALAVVCLYQLSFTIVTSVVQGNAAEYADGDKDKMEHYLDSMSHEPVYNLLVKNYTFGEAKARELNLGLDLQGGMHVTLQVSMKDLLLELSNHNEDEDFRKALQMASEQYRQTDANYINLFYQAYQKTDPEGQLASIFATRQNKDQISYNTSNEEVISFLKEEAANSLDRTFNILRTRVDQFGVSQPNLPKLPGTGRIIVE